MRLTANKPCTFGGIKFLIGDEIPVNLVANPKAQEKMGVLSIAADGENTPQEVETKFLIPIQAESGEIELVITNEELNVFTAIRQIGVTSTEDKQRISVLIQNIESLDLLIFLDAFDGRKYVKEESQARAKVISEMETATDEAEQGEQTGGDE